MTAITSLLEAARWIRDVALHDDSAAEVHPTGDITPCRMQGRGVFIYFAPITPPKELVVVRLLQRFRVQHGPGHRIAEVAEDRKYGYLLERADRVQRVKTTWPSVNRRFREIDPLFLLYAS